MIPHHYQFVLVSFKSNQCARYHASAGEVLRCVEVEAVGDRVREALHGEFST